MTLMMKYQLFSVPTEFAIAEIAFNRIKLTDQAFHIGFAWLNGQKGRRHSNKEPLPLRKSFHDLFRVQRGGVQRKIPINGRDDGFLIIGRWHVPNNPWKPKLE